MTTTIRRNDPCPCGSGKKYKKCCLKEKGVVQLHQVKEERYLQQKHHVTEKLNHFINEKLSAQEVHHLSTTFRSRSNGVIVHKEVESNLFRFWLQFFHRFENGMRGIEWFDHEVEEKLAPSDRLLVKRWTSLQPRIVQATDKTDAEVVFEDVRSNELFSVTYPSENVSNFAPWYGTIGFVEEVGNEHYLHGQLLLEGPKVLKVVKEKVEELMIETGLPFEDVCFDSFPEVIAILFSNGFLDHEAEKTKDIIELTIEADITNHDAVANYFYQQDEFMIDEWTTSKKMASWVGNWQAYTDSEIKDSITTAEVYGKLTLGERQLTFTCFNEQTAASFNDMLKGVGMSINNIAEKKNTIPIPFHAIVKNMMVQLSPDTPKYMALYVQLAGFVNIDEKIPEYDNLSLRELVEAGREIEAETWLRQTEYNTYVQVKEQYKEEIAVTADFNTTRKELGLRLSPFVTGGDNRITTIESIASLNEKAPVITNEEIPIYEALGFTPDTVNNFYTADLISFYKEKTTGKGDNTVRKYKTNLYDLREALELSELSSWTDCGQSFWEELVAVIFIEINKLASKTHIRDFISTVNVFAKWLDKNKGTMIAKDVQMITNETKDQLMSAAELFDRFDHYNADRKKGVDVIKGYLQVVAITNESISAESVQDGKTYTIQMSADELAIIQEGMILAGDIGRDNLANYEIVHLECVYPGQAKEYVKER